PPLPTTPTEIPVTEIPGYVPTPPTTYAPTPSIPGYVFIPGIPSVSATPGYLPAPVTPGYVPAPSAPGYIPAPSAPEYVLIPGAPGYAIAPSAPGYVYLSGAPGYLSALPSYIMPPNIFIEINCHWTEWYQWSSCEKTCHHHMKYRFRECIGGNNCTCSGDAREEMSCLLPPECNN
ncbi:unnamed protein product, partial [Onchocerca flexuosa]|uniref:EB domain-containing protein n=1 Tax=Onchocerca flexuosa TaxID=387005 RepID=A0A183HQP4_9BILA